MQRVVTGSVLLVLLWASIVPAPPAAFVTLWAAGISIACWECYGLIQRNGARPLRLLGVAGCWALIASFVGRAPLRDATTVLLAFTLAALLLAMALRGSPREMLETVCITAFPVYFVGLTLCYMIALRCLPDERGKDPLLMLFLCVVLGDTAAMTAGRYVGGPRLAPLLSPRKTWAGAIAGVLASLGGALLARAWFYGDLPLRHALALGPLLGLAAILGDLGESLIKRAGGAKDSSGLLPGHGGVLDRMDSLLFSGPILYYYWMLLLRESP